MKSTAKCRIKEHINQPKIINGVSVEKSGKTPPVPNICFKVFIIKLSETKPIPTVSKNDENETKEVPLAGSAIK